MKTKFKYGKVFDDASQVFRWDLYSRIGVDKYFKNKKILDLGCGFGLDSENFLKFAKSVTGADSIQYKNWKYIKKVKFVKSYSEKLPFKDNDFSGIFLKDLLHHVKKPEITLAEINRVSSNKATIIVLEGNRYNPVFFLYSTKLKKHEHFTQEQFKNLILKEFPKAKFLFLEAYPPFMLNSFIFKYVVQIEKYIERIKFLHSFFSYNVAIIKK